MNQYPPPGQPEQYGQPGQYGPGHYGQPGQYGQAGQYGQPQQFPGPPPGPHPPPGGSYWQESPQRKGMAITALVFGILGLLTFWTVLLTVVGVLCGLVAIVLGVIALLRARRGRSGGFGMALAGAILGGISLIGGVIVGLLVWIVFKDTGGTDLIDCLQRAGNDQSKVQQCQDEYKQRVEDKFSVTLTPSPAR
ncbi:DUF4190 domain-containing protein [Nocardia yunnanensis]|uniref:DUF4190 domain-containing protein n=1 Tax=Nocardia yunnanensis TaxID=2382165 RepID=A0A386Z9Z3_9NOCA|nr:DUF4190 domain-containing protein [Nocardia yunnanensis]AYF74632.1 DUF4190 domain-containing protein [Nocardia yunnanensis]